MRSEMEILRFYLGWRICKCSSTSVAFIKNSCYNLSTKCFPFFLCLLMSMYPCNIIILVKQIYHKVRSPLVVNEQIGGLPRPYKTVKHFLGIILYLLVNYVGTLSTILFLAFTDPKIFCFAHHQHLLWVIYRHSKLIRL